MNKNKKGWPTKTTLNLVVRERTLAHPTRLIPILLVIALVAVLVGKFGVADRLATLAQAESGLTSLNQQLASLQESYADYDEVEAEYNRYTYKDFDRTLADRLDVLALLDREVFPVSTVQRLAVSGRTLSLTLAGLSLERTSSLIARLERDDLVESVAVSTSNYELTTGEGEIILITNMTITLADATKGGEG